MRSRHGFSSPRRLGAGEAVPLYRRRRRLFAADTERGPAEDEREANKPYDKPKPRSGHDDGSLQLWLTALRDHRAIMLPWGCAAGSGHCTISQELVDLGRQRRRELLDRPELS